MHHQQCAMRDGGDSCSRLFRQLTEQSHTYWYIIRTGVRNSALQLRLLMSPSDPQQGPLHLPADLIIACGTDTWAIAPILSGAHSPERRGPQDRSTGARPPRRAKDAHSYTACLQTSHHGVAQDYDILHCNSAPMPTLVVLAMVAQEKLKTQ